MGRRDAVARALERTGLGALLRRAGVWNGLLALTYHRIGDGSRSPFERNHWTATAEQLDAQVRFLVRNADVVGPQDVPDLAGRRGRHLLLTFDDGYRDNHDVALPILRRHGATATFFVSTGFVDRPRLPWWDEVAWMVRTSPRAGVRLAEADVRFDEGDRLIAITALADCAKRLPGASVEAFLDRLGEAAGTGRAGPQAWPDQWMTWDHVRALLRAGMTVGGHTVDHPILARLGPDAQRAEIEGCRRRLREELGIPMRWFSYPNGDATSFDTATRAALADAGVELAFTFGGSHPRLPSLDLYAITRSTVSLKTSGALFAGMVTAPRLFVPPRPAAPVAPAGPAAA